MIPARYYRQILLMLFVLLQCMVPLAHAHVDGNHADQHAHLAVADTPAVSEHFHPSDSATLHHDDTHSVVVCMPPEFRYGTTILEQPIAACNQGNIAVSGEYASSPAAFTLQVRFAETCQIPDSQAPPA